MCDREESELQTGTDPVYKKIKNSYGFQLEKLQIHICLVYQKQKFE